ncbi:MAG: hypothetical protein II220_00680, partial [Spirochaetales bacterium]|nr:hypothetical protein [Spirochaetales bacterium]
MTQALTQKKAYPRTVDCCLLSVVFKQTKMNKIYKLLIICLLLVVGGGDALNAQSVGDTFTKTYNEGLATAYTLTFKITKLTPKECSLIVGTNPSSATTLTIPISVNGYSVTTIGNHAFRSCKDFTGSLTIPNSVTS